MVYVRVIGDIHGHIHKLHCPQCIANKRSYKHLIEAAEYSVQLGDFCFDYSALKAVDPVKHRIVAGNHDNYDALTPHFLGDFGVHSFGKFQFFFVRGAYSIDRFLRIEGRSWWRQEELDWDQCNQCIDAWTAAKPKIVLSHDCPWFLVPQVATNGYKMTASSTGKLFDQLFSIHEPELWIFGHHHQNKVIVVHNTKFMAVSGQCGNGMQTGYVDFDEDGQLIGGPF